MNKEQITKLYGLAEELKSYTDLSQLFDISSAQRRLWPMNPILKDNDLPEIQKLYDDLIESLEMAHIFDRVAFSKKVDVLFDSLETLQKA